ncbi:hypothetical protein AMTRI_Chr01g130960 [Amborella trichopoda]
MILKNLNILVLFQRSPKMPNKRKSEKYSTISLSLTLNQNMHLFSINDLIFETLQDKAHPKLMILIIFNILLSTKELLKCRIMKFLGFRG